jgi:hypothetical protein
MLVNEDSATLRNLQENGLLDDKQPSNYELMTTSSKLNPNLSRLGRNSHMANTFDNARSTLTNFKTINTSNKGLMLPQVAEGGTLSYN